MPAQALGRRTSADAATAAVPGAMAAGSVVTSAGPAAATVAALTGCEAVSTQHPLQPLRKLKRAAAVPVALSASTCPAAVAAAVTVITGCDVSTHLLHQVRKLKLAAAVPGVGAAGTANTEASPVAAAAAVAALTGCDIDAHLLRPFRKPKRAVAVAAGNAKTKAGPAAEAAAPAAVLRRRRGRTCLAVTGSRKWASSPVTRVVLALAASISRSLLLTNTAARSRKRLPVPARKAARS